MDRCKCTLNALASRGTLGPFVNSGPGPQGVELYITCKVIVEADRFSYHKHVSEVSQAWGKATKVRPCMQPWQPPWHAAPPARRCSSPRTAKNEKRFANPGWRWPLCCDASHIRLLLLQGSVQNNEHSDAKQYSYQCLLRGVTNRCCGRCALLDPQC